MRENYEQISIFRSDFAVNLIQMNAQGEDILVFTGKNRNIRRTDHGI